MYYLKFQLLFLSLFQLKNIIMKFLYLCSFLSFLTIWNNKIAAQLSIEPNPAVVLDIDVSEFDIVAHSIIKNETDEIKSFTWLRNVISIEDTWLSAVCDKNLCYLPHISTPPQNFTLNPQEEGTLDVHIYPYSAEGSAIIEIIVTDVDNPENTITGTYYFNVSPTGNKERISNNIKFFPNPAREYIMIDYFEGLTTIEVFALDGKMVLTNHLISDNKVDISSLSQGTYILRMKDKNGRQLSSNVLMKK